MLDHSKSPACVAEVDPCILAFTLQLFQKVAYQPGGCEAALRAVAQEIDSLDAGSPLPYIERILHTEDVISNPMFDAYVDRQTDSRIGISFPLMQAIAKARMLNGRDGRQFDMLDLLRKARVFRGTEH